VTGPLESHKDRPWPCPRCEYDLRGAVEADPNSIICPECGSVNTIRSLLRAMTGDRPLIRGRWFLAAMVPYSIAVLAAVVVVGTQRMAGFALILALGLVLSGPVAFFVLGSFAFRHRRRPAERWLTAIAVSLVHSALTVVFVAVVVLFLVVLRGVSW